MTRIPYRAPPVGTDAIADAIRLRRGARGLSPLDKALLNAPEIAVRFPPRARLLSPSERLEHAPRRGSDQEQPAGRRARTHGSSDLSLDLADGSTRYCVLPRVTRLRSSGSTMRTLASTQGSPRSNLQSSAISRLPCRFPPPLRPSLPSRPPHSALPTLRPGPYMSRAGLSTS